MEIKSLSKKAEEKARPFFDKIEETSFLCTQKVLSAFNKYRVQDACFNGSSGYGYDDLGRDTIENIYAEVFGGEKALVRQTFVNGTHTIGCAMFACLKTGDKLISATGDVYDTLQTVTGQRGAIGGTFKDYNIGYEVVPLKDGKPDILNIQKSVADESVKAVSIQLSRWYGDRLTLSC